LRPSSPYSAAKAGGDLQVLAYVRTYGVRASITRGANTYGANQYPEKLIPLFVTNALDGEPLPVYGDGKQVREWLHAEDHCAAVELVLHEGRPGEVYNVGGEDFENLEVTNRILELTGADPGLVRHVEDRAGHDRRYAVDDTKLRALGWVPSHSFGETGLPSTVDWYRGNRAWWEPIKSGSYRAYYDAQYGERLKA
jgi:dTDP-glucose 4,6-dehydratase